MFSDQEHCSAQTARHRIAIGWIHVSGVWALRQSRPGLYRKPLFFLTVAHVSACYAILAASLSPWLPKREAPPRFLLTTTPEGARSRLRTGTARIQPPRHVCRPVAMDHLSLRLAALAFGGGDNMLHGRPREPEFPRDRGWFGASLEGGEDRSLLSTGAALFAALDSADTGFGGSGLSTRCPGSGEWLGRLSPRRQASSTTAFTSRSSCTSSSRRNDRSKAVGRARPGACRWIPPLPGLRVMAVSLSACCGRSRKTFTASGKAIDTNFRNSRKVIGMTNPLSGAGTRILATVKRYDAAMGYGRRDHGRDHPLPTVSSYPLGRRPGGAPHVSGTTTRSFLAVRRLDTLPKTVTPSECCVPRAFLSVR